MTKPRDSMFRFKETHQINSLFLALVVAGCCLAADGPYSDHDYAIGVASLLFLDQAAEIASCRMWL